MFRHDFTFFRRRGLITGVGFHQEGWDRVDPSLRDRRSSTCVIEGISGDDQRAYLTPRGDPGIAYLHQRESRTISIGRTQYAAIFFSPWTAQDRTIFITRSRWSAIVFSSRRYVETRGTIKSSSNGQWKSIEIIAIRRPGCARSSSHFIDASGRFVLHRTDDDRTSAGLIGDDRDHHLPDHDRTAQMFCGRIPRSQCDRIVIAARSRRDRGQNQPRS